MSDVLRQIRMVPVASLKFNALNSRTHPDAQIEQLDGTRIDEGELQRKFEFEMRMGRAQGNLAIAEALRAAMKAGNAAATIYLSKVHLKWTERSPSKTASRSRPPKTLPSDREMSRILSIRRRSSRQS